MSEHIVPSAGDFVFHSKGEGFVEHVFPDTERLVVNFGDGACIVQLNELNL